MFLRISQNIGQGASSSNRMHPGLTSLASLPISSRLCSAYTIRLCTDRIKMVIDSKKLLAVGEAGRNMAQSVDRGGSRKSLVRP